jgi:hypothetical protein
MGNGIAGEIAELGANADGVKIGERVVVCNNLSCGSCRYCRVGRETLCLYLNNHTAMIGAHRDGGYAEFVCVPARNCVVLPAEVSFEQACLIPNTIGPVVKACSGRAGIRAGENVLIVGAGGGMGLHAAWAAVAANLSGSRSGLAQEMRRVEVEVGFGNGWAASLADATTRTGLPEFRALGSLLEQTERFGTEMAQMIRVMSDSLRHDEVQTLEERAHRASVMLLVPLSGLLLPGSLILMFAPPFMLLLEGMNSATP